MTAELSRPIADSLGAGAAAAAPTAGVAVATIAAPPAGIYRLSVIVQNTGTAETTAAGLTNMGLYAGATLKAALPTTGSPVRQEFERVTLDGATAVTVKATAAAAAGSMYVASIIATRLAQ